MTIDPLHDAVERHVAQKGYASILDVGGWFLPYPRATHVIDLMPWETRAGRLQLQSNQDECFSKATWIGLDICDPSTRFPFADKSIDFVMCSGTIEDLPDPQHCIQEMERVGRAGYIRVPSMPCELTIGVEDRSNNVIGYFHHHWVCRHTDPGKFLMMSKVDAGLHSWPGQCIPLKSFERLLINEPHRYDRSDHMFWEGTYTVTFQTGPEAKDAVRRYIASLNIPFFDHVHDSMLRRARRVRDRLKHKGAFMADKVSWWDEMLRISKPYAVPELFRRAGGKP